ncbi:pickpocket protein 28-like [Nilaparvata lugens]|uniref:pickpocket protein 28-like n=1 Tax=Nilaparvata lugens TaxID=108931 RepID=UPI00193C8CB7|nr:pickpocket protein 28-like [Nilaparvata lugens]
MSVSTPDIFAHPSLKRSNVNPHFKAFRQNTSLHGVKYICDPSRHWIERCFWCLVVASCIISLYAIYQMKMSQWRETPMTIEVSHVPQHISTLPVPALTVCGSLSLSNETVETFLNNTGYDFNFLKNIADTLGMAIEAFDKEYNMTSDCGKRFILSDSILQSILHHVNFKNNLVSIIDYAEPLMCFATYTFRGLCMSCNMAPPSKIYKIDSVRNFLRDDNERYGPKQLDIEYKSELKSDAIHGFPSFQVDRKDSQNISSWQKPKYPPLVRNPSIEYFFHTYLKSTATSLNTR